MHFWSSFVDILWWSLAVFVVAAYLIAGGRGIGERSAQLRRAGAISDGVFVEPENAALETVRS